LKIYIKEALDILKPQNIGFIKLETQKSNFSIHWTFADEVFK
jgi:hypothetical protein|tara:strand:- start:388 stop:513 length:126 start_codon:yes stop_codon:yes gene_type:complete